MCVCVCVCVFTAPPPLQAVCCEDHLHCCPHGTVCNLEASTCDDPTVNTAVMPWLQYVPVLPIETDKCDKSTSCPGKSTCCRTVTGEWACCPLPQVRPQWREEEARGNKTLKCVRNIRHTWFCSAPFRPCAATTTSTAALTAPSATWRLKRVMTRQVPQPPSPGRRRSPR